MALSRILRGLFLGIVLQVTARLGLCTEYSVNPIPLPAGWTSSFASGINNSGQVVGHVSNGTTSQAFIGTPASITPIPLPAGWTSAYALGINNLGQIVGYLYNGTTYQAFIGAAAGITPIQI